MPGCVKSYSYQFICSIRSSVKVVIGKMDFDDGTDTDQGSKNHIFYIGYAVVVLLVINILCMMVYCFKRTGKHIDNKIRYDVVSMESTDAEDGVM